MYSSLIQIFQSLWPHMMIDKKKCLKERNRFRPCLVIGNNWNWEVDCGSFRELMPGSVGKTYSEFNAYWNCDNKSYYKEYILFSPSSKEIQISNSLWSTISCFTTNISTDFEIYFATSRDQFIIKLQVVDNNLCPGPIFWHDQWIFTPIWSSLIWTTNAVFVL